MNCSFSNLFFFRKKRNRSKRMSSNNFCKKELLAPHASNQSLGGMKFRSRTRYWADLVGNIVPGFRANLQHIVIICRRCYKIWPGDAINLEFIEFYRKTGNWHLLSPLYVHMILKFRVWIYNAYYILKHTDATFVEAHNGNN